MLLGSFNRDNLPAIIDMSQISGELSVLGH